MGGVIGLLAGGEVALPVSAIGRTYRQRVIVADVAVAASVDPARGGQLVPAGQRKTSRRVVEGRRQKRRGIVTARAARHGEYRRRLRMQRLAGSLLRATPVAIHITPGVPATASLTGRDV